MPAAAVHLQSVLDRMDYGRALKEQLLMPDRPAMQVPYTQPLLDAVGLFERLGVGYALIGGIAAMYYGRTRFTEDVDFVAMAGHMDVLSAHPAAMEEFHFSPECVTKLYHQSGVSVDVWKDDHADRIIQNAVEVQLAGRNIRLVEPHDLLAMKLRAGRLKDDYDISQIIQAMSIDESRLAKMVDAVDLKHFYEIKARG